MEVVRSKAVQVAMIPSLTVVVIHVDRGFCGLGDQCMDNLIGQGRFMIRLDKIVKLKRSSLLAALS